MKKFITIALLCFIMGFAGNRAEANTLSFQFSNNENYNISINASQKMLYFTDFPSDSIYDFVMLQVINTDGDKLNQIFTGTESGVVYDLGSLDYGHYTLEMYFSSERYSTYTSYLYGSTGLKLEINQEGATIVLPGTYEKNKELFASRRSDEEALKYYLMPSYGIESDAEEIKKLAGEITAGIEDNYEKAKAIHNWVCANIYYNYDQFYGKSSGDSSGALSTLENKRSVCQGYASLSAALLRASGIPAKIVSGYALGLGISSDWTDDLINSEMTNHAWNEAFIEGRWVIIDTTWDSNNQYQDGSYSVDTGISGYRYYDPTIEMFSIDHRMVSDDTEIEDYYNNIMLELLDQVVITPGAKTLYYNRTNSRNVTLVLGAPIEAYDYGIKFTYSSSNPTVAKVNTKGKITALKPGKTTIATTVKIGKVTSVYHTFITVKKYKTN